MDLYDRQAMHRKWLQVARGDVRLVEDALKRANALARESGQATTSEMVIQEIEKLVAAYA